MKYKKNFISDVICRLNFPEISELKTEEPIGFHKKIKTLLPRVEKGVEVTLFKDDKGVSIKNQFNKWDFSNKEKDKKVILSSIHMALEFLKYNNFKEFKEFWEKACNSLLEIYEVKFFDRLGLRYINHIYIKKGNPLNWDKLINKFLTNNFKCFPDLKSDIIRTMHQTIFNKDGIKINFNYGILNENFPNTLSKKEYILDYDCYCDYAIEPSEISDKLSEFIKIIYDLFERSIDDKLREIMGVEK